MKIKIDFRSLVVFTSLLLLANASSAVVKNKTVEIDVVENGKVVAKRVVVNCRAEGEKRTILKRAGNRKWCDATLTEMCASDKNDLAESVCRGGYLRKIAAKQQQVDKSGQLSKLKTELMEIERKRLDIADKVLELKRKEIELRKTLG